MENVLAVAYESSGLLPWLRQMLKEEIAPYPGRGIMVARMVISATFTMILVNDSSYPGGL